jgi:hypothetical protein
LAAFAPDELSKHASRIISSVLEIVLYAPRKKMLFIPAMIITGMSMEFLKRDCSSPLVVTHRLNGHSL